MKKAKTAVIIPTFNGKDIIHKSLDSLLGQVSPENIIVVENGSSDDSGVFLSQKYPEVQLLPQTKNLGFSGGVNAGIKQALVQDYKYIALFNNDAVAEKDWLGYLEKSLDTKPHVGIATGKILDKSEKRLDSTGDIYSTWGLPFPRGRGQKDEGQYDQAGEVFGASGGASLYRAEVLKQIGLFDEDFFAYYEDVDLSFRAQLAGWKVLYEPKAIVYHTIGATSSKMSGFSTYHTFKNLPALLWKNVPLGLLPVIFPRFVVLYSSIYASAIVRGQGGPATKGFLMSVALWPKKLWQRRRIQSSKAVPTSYISSIVWRDLPPDAYKLRAVRKYFSLGFIK